MQAHLALGHYDEGISSCERAAALENYWVTYMFGIGPKRRYCALQQSKVSWQKTRSKREKRENGSTEAFAGASVSRQKTSSWNLLS
jgi:hypothetical protein